MGTPHKHAEIIKAWADGSLIQYRSAMEWRDQSNPSFSTDYEWRIKPEPKPDVVTYANMYSIGYCSLSAAIDAKERSSIGMLKLTTDGETGKLKSAEVLK